MAQGVGSANAVLGWSDTFGGKGYAPVDYKGPTSYVQGGDAINPAIFGLTTILTLIGSVDQSGTYEVVGRPLQNGIGPWQLVWKVVATGAQVAAAVNLSTFSVRLSAIGR